MNHSDKNVNVLQLQSWSSPDMLVNLLAILVISGLIYKGITSSLENSSDSMFSKVCVMSHK